VTEKPTGLMASQGMWVVRLPTGLPLLNANQRLHWRKRSDITKALRAAGKQAALDARVPRLERAHIDAVYKPPNRRRRDVANLYPSFKAVIDGLVDAGVLEDDDDKHLTGPDMRLGAVMPGGQIVLNIHEVTL